jgi:hypothetical protein
MTPTLDRPRALLILPLACALLGTLGSAGAEPRVMKRSALHVGMVGAAREIKARLDRLPGKEKTVWVNGFICPTFRRASGGAELRLALVTELTRLGVKLADNAAVGIIGTFHDASDKDSGDIRTQVNLRLEDRHGEPIGKRIVIDVPGAEAYARLFGITLTFDPRRKLHRCQDYWKAWDRPTVAVSGSRVCSKAGSKLSVEVLAVDNPTQKTKESDYKPLPARVKDGQAFVSIRRGQSYAVRMINDSDFDAVITLSIDGMGLFTFSEEKNEKTGLPRQYRILVPRKDRLLVRGWFINHKETDLFQVSEYARRLRALTGGCMTDVGTITVTFAACWETGKPAPPDEPRPDDHKGTATTAPVRDDSERGLRVPAHFKSVPRTVGATRDIISVRYAR